MIMSIHHYELAASTSEAEFREAVSEAERRGLFDLPGLVEYRFLRGLKGTRAGKYTALWTYESREAWERLWGPVENPVEKDQYPEPWRQWEDELLAPLVSGDPDAIDFTSYELVDAGRPE
jgi:hypothetical protein